MERTRTLVAASLIFALLPSLSVRQDAAAPEYGAGPNVGNISLTVDGTIANLDLSADSRGNALYQGDIIFGPLASVLNLPQGVGLMDLGDEHLFGLAIRGREFRWPNAVVRYSIDPDLPDQARVFSAMQTWRSEAGVVFEEANSSSENQIVFVPGDGCSSYVGMVGGPQPLTLSEDCKVGNVIHEIGHALGLQHEQARVDRAEYVVVFSQNILPGREGNFEPDPTTYEEVGPYCYDSIMHYSAYAFSRDPANLVTIETVPPGQPIGQRSYLAPCDLETFSAIYALADQPVTAAFEGVLDLYPEGCQARRQCYLRNDIIFTDPSNLRWKAGKRDPDAGPGIQTGLTDGATIPDWAQRLIGEPYSDEYLLAAVVHDHYCYDENHVRGWRETHRMFYDALLALGVPMVKAKIMYAAVYLGGPKWTSLVLGESCGPNCVFDASGTSESPMPSITLFRDDDYGSASFLRVLSDVETRLAEQENLSLADIEAIIHERRGDDFFYRTPGHLNVTAP